MTTTRAQKVRIAMFAIATGTLLALVLVLFAGVHFWKDRTPYHIVFEESVYGLEVGADVYFNGVRVGKVTRMTVVPDDVRLVRIDIEVDASTPIHTDTRAYVRFAGITGLKELDLRDGTSATPRLAPNMRIDAGESMLDRLEQKAERLADQTMELMARANTALAQADAVAENLAELTDPAQLGSIVTQAKRTANNLATASAALKGLVEDNRAGLRASIDAIETAARRTAQLVDSGQLSGALRDLRQASRSFKELAREVRQRPSRLLYSRPPPERKLP